MITHASTQTARFLGYELGVQYSDDKRDHTDRLELGEIVDFERLTQPARYEVIVDVWQKVGARP